MAYVTIMVNSSGNLVSESDGRVAMLTDKSKVTMVVPIVLIVTPNVGPVFYVAAQYA